MAEGLIANSLSIDQLESPSDVEVMEVYHGATTPIQYTGRFPCGTVMMWGRDPGTTVPIQIFTKKFLAAVGFVLIALFSVG